MKHANPAARNRTHRQFFIPRNAELSHDQYIERHLQGLQKRTSEYPFPCFISGKVVTSETTPEAALNLPPDCCRSLLQAPR